MRFVFPIWLWAARDLIRRPFESILMALALSSLIIVASVSLFLSQGISETAKKLLEHGPSVVVRRVVSGHWFPVPIKDAVTAAVSVPGVISATPRIWGVATGPEGPVTVMGVSLTNQNIKKLHPDLGQYPGRGQAIIGPGVLSSVSNGKIDADIFLFNGRQKMTVKVTGVLPEKNSMAVHDIILLAESDARHLLELEEGYASDLAIEVFHEQEADAMLSELVDAFPWPVSLTTKNETLKIYSGSVSRYSGLIYLALGPSVLALALIVLAGFKGTRGRIYEAGLLKAMGWTTNNIVSFFMCRAALVAFPACGLGMTVASVIVYSPGISWPGYLFFGWQTNAPGLYLNPEGAVMILLQVGAGVLLPYMVSNLWPAIENASAEPHQLLQNEGGW